MIISIITIIVIIIIIIQPAIQSDQQLLFSGDQSGMHVFMYLCILTLFGVSPESARNHLFSV
jgi:hypothetical protein